MEKKLAATELSISVDPWLKIETFLENSTNPKQENYNWKSAKKSTKKMNLTVGLFGFHLTKSRRWIEATLKVNSESVKRLQLSLSVKSKQFSSEFNCRWIQEEFGSWIELKFRKNKTSQSMKSVVELNRVPVGCSFFLWLFWFQLKASFRVQ